MRRRKKLIPTVGVSGLVLKQARERLGWSLDDLASRSGIPGTTLYKIERTARTMRHGTAIALAETFTEAGFAVSAEQLRGSK